MDKTLVKLSSKNLKRQLGAICLCFGLAFTIEACSIFSNSSPDQNQNEEFSENTQNEPPKDPIVETFDDTNDKYDIDSLYYQQRRENKPFFCCVGK